MITKNRNNPTEILENIESAIKKNVARIISEKRLSYQPVYEMEELPDQKKRLSMDELKTIARRVERHSAAGTNDDETEEENGSVSGKEKTLLQIEKCGKKYENDDEDEEDEEDELEESFKNMSNDELKTWIKKNDTDESGISVSFGMQLKSARKELKRRGLKLSSLSENLEKYKKFSNAEIMKKYKAMKNGKNQKEIDDLVQEIEYRGLSEAYVLMTHSAPKQYFKKSENKGNVAWKPTGVLSQATRFDTEEEADDFRKNSKERKFDNSLYSAKIVKLTESVLDESADLKKIAKGKKDVTIELDDGEDFELDPDTASVLISKASEKEIKAAMKDYTSMMKLINKVLR